MIKFLKGKYYYYKQFPHEVKFDINVFITNLLWRIFIKYEIVHFLISCLCHLEMNLKLFLNKELQYKGEECIPDKDDYCYGCIFRDCSIIAYWLLGNQSCGYCHLIRNGDFDYFPDAPFLLWDGCKECGIKMDIELS